MKMLNKQSGVALVMVLWILLLVTITTGAYTLMARMDNLEAHTILWSTKARLAAEAGMHFAVLSLRDPEEEYRWIADGRPYEILYDGSLLEVQITDERGKVNINSINEEALEKLFTTNGLDANDALLLAAAVLDWRDGDELVRPNGAEEEDYLAGGYQVGPANRDFIMVEELLQVIGLPWELFEKMQPGLTVWSDQGMPEPAFAPVEALLALPEITQEEALNFVEERHSQDGSEEEPMTLSQWSGCRGTGTGGHV